MQKEDMLSAIAAAETFNPDMLLVPNILYGPYMCLGEALGIPVVTFDLQVNHPTSEYPLYTMEVGKVPNFLNRTSTELKGWFTRRQSNPSSR